MQLNDFVSDGVISAMMLTVRFLAAYIAIELQQQMVGKERNIAAEDVDLLSWIFPLLGGSAVAAVIGVVMFQAFLRWNQGEELRQALITIAIAVILADQMLARAGGLRLSTAPRRTYLGEARRPGRRAPRTSPTRERGRWPNRCGPRSTRSPAAT